MRGTLWVEPPTGFLVYVACVVLYPPTMNADVSQTGLWSRVAIATELGGVLRTLGPRAPHGHRAFSELVFGRDSMGADLMSEGDIEAEAVGRDEGEIRETGQSHTQATCLGYLEDDDIEEW